ncbi:MAG TPA: AMP-binding protein [Rubrobacteraceae bacterium]|nr:AMP-binding protein [Rubrobacteraceae bacterium]
MSTAQLVPGTVEAWERHLERRLEGDSSAASLRAELTEGSLPQAFHATAKRHPERTALIIDDVTITHEELDRLAAKAGGWLGARGVGPGQRIILCGQTSLDFVVAYMGILRIGAVVVPAGAALTEHEMRHLVEDSGAMGALAQGDALNKLVPISRGNGDLRLVIALERGAKERGAECVPSLQQGIIEGEPVDPREAERDEAALLAYTSGTTGHPKGVPLSHANLLSSIRAVMMAWRWDEQDVLVHALPLSHQHGLGGIHASLLAGSRAVVHGKFDPGKLCAAIESEKATVLFAVPSMYERLAAWEGIEGVDFSSLRLAVSGSSALSPALASAVSSVIGLEVLERYGSTESGLSVSNPYEGPRRFGTVGLPLPGTELSIVDEEGRRLPPGSDGEIVLRGPQVFSGYLGLPDATRDSFFPGGWFRTGDVGCVDPEDGYLAVTGRLKELIISGGLNVYPREVELALEDHPAVSKAAVVGVPSERWGEEVVAFVVAARGHEVDTEALTAHARQRLSAYKRPKRFLEIDQLPRNEMGKVLRGELVRTASEKPRAGP